MYKKPFMFSVEMLADMTGGNKQYLSKKIKKLTEDPQIQLKAVLKSKKEGYQISEEEVLRCFDKITPGQIQEYKERYLARGPLPGVRMLTADRSEESSRDPLAEENRILIEWKVRLAATAPDQKSSPAMREYLQQEIEKIKALKEEKLKEYVMLEMFLENCDRMIEAISQRLNLPE